MTQKYTIWTAATQFDTKNYKNTLFTGCSRKQKNDNDDNDRDDYD